MTALIILAAGASSRLGQPKQNLIYQGKTLLQHAVTTGLQTNCHPIIVVLGAHAEQIEPLPGIQTLYNKDWQEGMSSSIRLAVREIYGDPAINQVIMMVCDQPFVSADLLNALIHRQTQTGLPMVAAAYQSAVGVPALFDRSLFAALLELKGSEGAKILLQQYAAQLATVPFEQGAIDIDTMTDYKQLPLSS